MVYKAGVSVRVADTTFVHGDELKYTHRFYEEYKVNRKTYIKSSTGELFLVIVDISPEFDFKGCPEVQIRSTIDGKEKAMWALSAVELAGLRAQNNMRRINHFHTERYVNNRWMHCALSFGELEIDDSVVLCPKVATKEANTLGRIVVTITRGSGEPCDPELLEPDECAEDYESAARAVVEGHHITHALKAVPWEERAQPVVQWHFTAARGHAGRPQELEIRYRSQEALELLGVTLKPEDDLKEEPEDRKDPATKAEQMLKLEEEVAIKIQSGAASSRVKKEQHSPVKPMASKSRCKAAPAPSKTTGQAQDIAASGTKRKRKATPAIDSTSKKVKREEPTLGPAPSSSRIMPRSWTKAKAKVKANDAAAAPKALSSDNKTVLNENDNDTDDKVEFLYAQPVRRIVGRYVID